MSWTLHESCLGGTQSHGVGENGRALLSQEGLKFDKRGRAGGAGYEQPFLNAMLVSFAARSHRRSCRGNFYGTD